MRSTDSPHSADKDAPPAVRFGALITELATQAGYDLTPGSGGRTHLARDTGMSPSAVGRMLDGKTLPMPQQLEGLARAVGEPIRTLLVSAGVISANSWPNETDSQVLSANSRSQTLSPEAAADMWGVTEPGIRSMLISSVQQAINLQREADQRRLGQGEAGRRR
ncbi:helix-turn-helix transcriptional regulator [Streptomyces sp. NPDC012617]|uniref:helix-turn-helix domain-containing protein n=1 Tax=Streptomyces TaxID=1883 RepID=UPI0033C0CBB6